MFGAFYGTSVQYWSHKPHKTLYLFNDDSLVSVSTKRYIILS